MEAVGNECKLEEVLHSGNLSMLQGQIGIEQADFQDVCKYLSLLKDHPLVKDMESALQSRDECQIIRPFGRYKGFWSRVNYRKMHLRLPCKLSMLEY
jgi:hypothetical protein